MAGLIKGLQLSFPPSGLENNSGFIHEDISYEGLDNALAFGLHFFFSRARIGAFPESGYGGGERKRLAVRWTVI